VGLACRYPFAWARSGDQSTRDMTGRSSHSPVLRPSHFGRGTKFRTFLAQRVLPLNCGDRSEEQRCSNKDCFQRCWARQRSWLLPWEALLPRRRNRETAGKYLVTGTPVATSTATV